MTYMPLKNSEPYIEAYTNWKKELEQILTHKK
jgi:xylulokinase